MGKNSLCAKVNRNSFLCKEISRRQTPLFLGHEQITTLLFRSGGPPSPHFSSPGSDAQRGHVVEVASFTTKGAKGISEADACTKQLYSPKDLVMWI